MFEPTEVYRQRNFSPHPPPHYHLIQPPTPHNGNNFDLQTYTHIHTDATDTISVVELILVEVFFAKKRYI